MLAIEDNFGYLVKNGFFVNQSDQYRLKKKTEKKQRFFLSKNKNYLLTYTLSNQCLITRPVDVVREDECFYYVNTGVLKETYIHKNDILKAVPI